MTVAIDEANGQSRTARADGFIGADGVHSQTRLGLLDGPTAQYRNRIAWRTLVPRESIGGQIAMDRVSVFFGSGFHLVCYPLPHRGQVNLALFMPGAIPPEGAQPRLRHAGPRFEALLTAAADSWTAWPMYTVDTPLWHQGNIGIIGDAAHAMVPFQAQGAAMGIEDAATLAPLLVGTESAETALSRYADIRQPRARRVAALSAENGRIFHMAWPFSLARNIVMRLQGPRGHLKRLAWVYSHDVGDSPAP